MPPTHLILGCGYLGRVVARRWLAAGHRVAALTRSRADELRSLGIEPVVGDVTDPAPSTAGRRHRPVRRRPGPLGRQVDARGLRRRPGERLQRAAAGPAVRLRQQHQRLRPDRRRLGRRDRPRPSRPRRTAGSSWKPSSCCGSGGRTRSILRFAGIYGPGRNDALGSHRARRSRSSTDPDGWLNLIHVEDGASAVVAAAERGQPGATYNVADDRPVARREFYAEMAALLGAPPPQFNPAAERTNRRISNRRMRRNSESSCDSPTSGPGCGTRSATGP